MGAAESPKVVQKQKVAKNPVRLLLPLLEFNHDGLEPICTSPAEVHQPMAATLLSRRTQSSLQFGRVLVRNRGLQDFAADSIRLFQHPLPVRRRSSDEDEKSRTSSALWGSSNPTTNKLLIICYPSLRSDVSVRPNRIDLSIRGTRPAAHPRFAGHDRCAPNEFYPPRPERSSLPEA